MVGDNIKKLREELGLTQTKFAERIALTQGAIASAESNKRNLSRQSLLAISNAFNVRIEWLETGEGEMYKQPDTSILFQLGKEYSLSPKSREFVENFLKLPPDVRDLVAEAVARAAELYPRKPDDKKSVDEMREETNRELNDVEAARKRGTITSSASIGSSGLKRKFGNGS